MTRKEWAKKAIIAYEQGQYDGVLITATGCSSQLKDYAHQFAGDPVWEPRAAKFAAAARDFAELCTPLPATPPRALRVAYHPACSLQNSLKLNGGGRGDAGSGRLHRHAVRGKPSVLRLGRHLFHPAAGTVRQLRARKLGNIAAAEPDVLVSGNIGCLQHLAAGEGQAPAHPAPGGTAGLGRGRHRNPPIWNWPCRKAPLSLAHAPRACPVSAAGFLCRHPFKLGCAAQSVPAKRARPSPCPKIVPSEAAFRPSSKRPKAPKTPIPSNRS